MSKYKQNLHPYRNYDPKDTLDFFALDGTGLDGLLVKVSANDPDDRTFFDANTSVGDSSQEGVLSNRWTTPKRVQTVSEYATRSEVLGITLEGAAEKTNHGNQIPGFNERYADENGFVSSGQPLTIAQRGLFRINIGQVTGVPGVGSGVASFTDGKLKVVDPATTSGEFVLGKFISSSGSRNGGYADFILNV